MARGRKGRDRRKRYHRSSVAARQSRMSDDTLLQEHISQIPRTPLSTLPAIIDLARQPCNVGFQGEVIRACLQRILSIGQEIERVPRNEQVRALRRPIFGKSVIFHAYSILTGRVTIQLIPLTKLGDEQLTDIRRFKGARPCLIDAKTRTAGKTLIRQVAQGKFTHVMLGPEQASTPSFREALRETAFQKCIGLVAIDECHFVLDWAQFRPAYTLLGELRTILHQDIVWFGCSATLNEKAETRVSSSAGFRSLGNNMYHTEVFRTSIDRPGIGISVVPIPRGKLNSYDSLYFLLLSAVCDNVATPAQIPKTIVFIDGRRSVHLEATWAMDMLLRLSDEYELCSSARERCVFNVVGTFTAHVSQYDRDRMYTEFQSPQSTIRIMFATTILGMGINIADVARVVTWKIPITNSLGDLWQRLGRGGRGADRTSISYIMLSYRLFNSEGCYRPGSSLGDTRKNFGQAIPRVLKRQRNQTPIDRALLRSYLSQGVTPGDAIDIDNDPAELPGTQFDSQETVDTSKRRFWTKAEMTKRDETDTPFLCMVNGPCHREGFLRELGEHKLVQSERQDVDPNRCALVALQIYFQYLKCRPSVLSRYDSLGFVHMRGLFVPL